MRQKTFRGVAGGVVVVVAAAIGLVIGVRQAGPGALDPAVDRVRVPARVELGNIRSLATHSFDISYRNDGEEEWTIDDISADCGCLISLAGQRTVEPYSVLNVPMSLTVPAMEVGTPVLHVNATTTLRAADGRVRIARTAVVGDLKPLILKLIPTRLRFARGESRRTLYLFGPATVVDRLPEAIQLAAGSITTVTLAIAEDDLDSGHIQAGRTLAVIAPQPVSKADGVGEIHFIDATGTTVAKISVEIEGAE